MQYIEMIQEHIKIFKQDINYIYVVVHFVIQSDYFTYVLGTGVPVFVLDAKLQFCVNGVSVPVGMYNPYMTASLEQKDHGGPIHLP